MPRARATWNRAVLADSADAVVVEGNCYFPRQDVREELLRPSRKRTWCPWKGVASYSDVVVNGHVNRAATWHYPQVKPAAEAIRDHVAFRRGVLVERME